MGTQEEIAARVRYLMKEMRYKQVEFAERIGVDASNLSKYINGHLPISDALINRIVVNLGVSKEWLCDGTDLPYAKPRLQASTVDVARDEVKLGSGGPGVPVYDIDVTAGTMPRAMMFADEQIVGRIDLPDLVNQNCRIVRVSGDSMYPVIQPGDYIAVKELSNIHQIFWGQIYVVLLDDYRLVKHVRRHTDPNMVILRSANTAYDDMEIYRNEIRDLMFVQTILHLDTRM